MLAKAKARYDPEAQRLNYMVNHVAIRAQDNHNRLLRQQKDLLDRLHELREAVYPAYKPLVEFAISERFHEKLFPAELVVIETLLLLATEKATPAEAMDMTDEGDDAEDIWMDEQESPSEETSQDGEEKSQDGEEESAPTPDPPHLIVTEINDFRERNLEQILARPGPRCLSAIDFLYQV